jgi:type I restriction enzyme S subunit
MQGGAMKEKTAETLPPGWKRVRLGDVCIEDKLIISGSESGLPYLGLEMIQSKTGIINWESSELDSKGTCFYFDERHVLYSKLRPYLNKVALPNKKGKCTTELIPLFPNQDVCREYLALLLRRNETVEYAMKEKTGSRMPRVNMTHLFNMIIPLPPLDEQKRIAESIEKKLQAVEKVKNAVKDELAYVEELSASILHQELTGGGGVNFPPDGGL